ncbi:M20/M25/M40 family metallo-hydrolase [Spirochaetota bacterium]
MKNIKLIHFLPFLFALLILFSAPGCREKPSPHYCEKSEVTDGMVKDDYCRLKMSVEKQYKGYKDLKELSEKLGHRMTGSKNGKLAEQFIFNRLKSFGYRVRYLPFKMNLWSRRFASLKIYMPGLSNALNTVSMAYTPVFSDIKARLVDGGNGLEADFEAVKLEVKGSIVLVNLSLMDITKKEKEEKNISNIHRSDKAILAEKYGAVGIIFVNKHYGGVLSTGTVSKSDKLISIPAVCITVEDAQNVRSLLEMGQVIEARLHVKNRTEKIKARNIIAVIKGKEKPGERIIIGGHLDTWDLGQGAIDNGIGSFAVLDIARAFKGAKIWPGRTVEFIFWMGEEHGLKGSRAFVKNEIKKNTIDSIKYYINVDMQANPLGFDVEGLENMEEYFLDIGEKIRSRGIDFKNLIRNEVSGASDNVPFAEQGIPVLQMISGLKPHVYRYYHSTRDNIDLVNIDHMKKSSLIMGLALYELSNDKNLNVSEIGKK